MIHSFLMIGQSNMAGRGDPREVEPIASEHLFVLRNGLWRTMYVPVNPDRKFSGVSLGESFALQYYEKHNTEVGLIGCADGGTTIDQWCPGGLLYDHAVMQARLAMRTSFLHGILWHQGESDCMTLDRDGYRQKLDRLFSSLRRDLGCPELPVVVGELGEYLKENPSRSFSAYTEVNEILREFAASGSNIGLASSKGLSSNPDCLHFNAAGLRIFGRRYEDALETLRSVSVGQLPADRREENALERL